MGVKAIQIDEKDNVATATGDVEVGEQLEVIGPDGCVVSKLEVSETIPFGHKLAIRPIKEGENILKYGEIIGIASKPIQRGAWLHVHNVKSARLPSKGKEEGIL